MRKSSVETLSPRSHCCSSFERSSANTSASRFIAEATSHRLLRPPCVARPRMQFELLSSDCANFPTHCLGTVALFGNSGAAASPLALCFGSLAACSRFCSTGICSPVTGLGPFGSVAARWRLARSAVVSFGCRFLGARLFAGEDDNYNQELGLIHARSGSAMCCYGMRVPAEMSSKRVFAIVARNLFTSTLLTPSGHPTKPIPAGLQTPEVSCLHSTFSKS